ncbi:MAG TPA: class I SAM-dependent methyltransferase [Micromonosporaceae bacterium]|nr:class I SAM-dependent methyltransferase [Micromonosporaceae bacterium]
MSPATAFRLVLALIPGVRALAQEADGTRDVGFVATPVALVTGMLDLAGVADTDVVYDLGSGDGRIVIAAARRGARGVGVELDSMLVEESRASADTAGVAARAEFRRADLFATDLRPATVVTLYLGRELNQRLRPIFLRDLRPGTRVVSQAFDMGDWPPDSVVTVRSREVAATPVHLWVIPADVAGRWALTLGADEAPAERLRLDLTQDYQLVRGTADSVRLERVRLRGDSVAFSAGGRRVAGRVSGNEVRGTVTAAGTQPRPWRAVRTGRR